MHKRTWLAAAVALVLVAGAGGAALGSQRGKSNVGPAVDAKAAVISDNAEISVDVVAKAPDQHLGRVTVTGSVTSIDASQHTFVLGCTDACVAVPVQFSGRLPKTGSNVVVRGTIAKSGEGKYAFAASDVRTR